MKNHDACWSVYLIECGDGTLYCGVTIDVAQRLVDHGSIRGARYVRTHGGVKRLLWSRNFGQRSIAQRVEIFMKRASRARKLAIANDANDQTIPSEWMAKPLR